MLAKTSVMPSTGDLVIWYVHSPGDRLKFVLSVVSSPITNGSLMWDVTYLFNDPTGQPQIMIGRYAKNELIMISEAASR